MNYFKANYFGANYLSANFLAAAATAVVDWIVLFRRRRR